MNILIAWREESQVLVTEFRKKIIMLSVAIL